jgi:pimeloyl-ACP methyl ester carboxylesterase
VHRHSVAVSGRRVNYYELGDGPALVMLHGLLGSPAYLAPLARSLAASGRRVLLPELPGHCGSDRLAPLELADLAELLADAMDAAGAERPSLFGHSLGAPLAVHWASRRPLAGLVCASPVGMVPLRLGLARRLLPAAPAITLAARRAAPWLSSTRAGRSLVFGWFVGMARPHAVPAPLGERMIREAVGSSPALVDYLPPLERLDLREAAAAVRCRALVVWGARDAHGANGEPLVAALGGEGHVIPDCGHMPMLEAPYSFRRALNGWL